MQGGSLLTNQLVAPPIGAFLFAAGMALPFATNAACFALGAVLVARIVHARRTEAASRARRRSGADLAEGVRWLLGHPPMRTLALTIFLFNVTFGAAWSRARPLRQRAAGHGRVGFGLLTTAVAIGGIVGTVSYGRARAAVRARRHHARRAADRDAAPISSLALTTSPAVALATFVVFGAHEFVWGTTSTVVRQRAVPTRCSGG